MAIANLEESLLFYTMRKNQLSQEIMSLQATKGVAVAETADTNSALAAGKTELRNFFKNLYKSDEEYYRDQNYKDYTDIPDFEEEMNKLVSKYQDKLDELAQWEEGLDRQITVNDTEIKEIEAYEESFKNMLSSNIQQDFKLSIGG